MSGCTFVSEFTGEVYIPSTWRRVTTTRAVETQTEILKTDENSTQTNISAIQPSEKLEKGEGHERLKLTKASLQGGWHYIYTNTEYDEEKLADFLENSEAKIHAILQKNARTNLYDNYVPNWSKRSTELSLVYTFSSPIAMENDLHALDTTWNASGAMLAVAYGRLDVSGWCNSSGCACVWNISRSDLDTHAPHFTLETDTYVTKAQFHPTQALCLALGTYSGDVILYPNITESQFFSTAGQGMSYHRDPISSLEWVQNLQETREAYRYILCVGSQDCKISLWSAPNDKFYPLCVYRIHNRRHITTGVSSVTFARPPTQGQMVNIPSINNAIIVGLESGDIGRGRISLISGLDKAKNNEKIVPTTLALDWMESHYGPIQAVQSSPFFRNLFMSCSSDGTARLYHLIDSNAPQLTLEPSADTKHFLYSAQFSPYRPGIIALVSRSSYLHIYDLQKSKAQPLYSMEAGVEGAPVTCVQFCHAAADLLATGDTRGNTRIWKLPTEVTQQTEVERTAIRNAQRGPQQDASEENTAFREIFGFFL